ncbi:MAG: acetyl-CoA hydrolase/transferase C-terminal domain-containing protein [Pseudomonadota bacterium]
MTLTDAIELIKPGMTVFVHGSATEPRALVDALHAASERLRDVHIITSFIPGINTVDIAGLAEGQRYTSFMASAVKPDAPGPREALRLPYSALSDYLTNLPQLDLAFIHGRAIGGGRVSTGLTGELLRAAVARAERFCLLDNQSMSLPAVGCELREPDYRFALEQTLIEYLPGGRADDVSLEIARHVANMIPDGATLQAGLGVIPSEVFALLKDRKNLRIMSGMVSDSLVPLAESGALDPSHEQIFGMALGSQSLYAWLNGRSGFRVADCSETHNRDVLTSIDGFHAVNSALEVALDGSINSEQLGSRIVSGPGGLPDYAFGGTHSAGGASMIALPASNRKRGISRIVPRLANHDSPTLQSGSVTHVVTEYGVADLRTPDAVERASRLIAIADPEHRAMLQNA